MQAVEAGSITLSEGILKAMLPGQAVGGGFVTIANAGAAADRLVSVSSPRAERVEIHEMTMENDIMKMRQLKDGLPVGAGETVTLAPGGIHLMLMGVENPLRIGETVPVTFTFEKQGAVNAVLPVVDARMAGGEGHHHK